MTELNTEKRQDLIKRIRALQAKTVQNGCTEQEALAAATLAAKLIDKFGFEQSELEIKLEPLTEDTYLGPGKTLAGAWYVASAIQDYCDVRAFREQVGDRHVIKVFGRETDVALANYLLNLCATAFVHEWRAFAKQYRQETGQTVAQKPGNTKRAFELGMGSRLSQRFKEMKAARNTQMDPNSNRTGKDLVLVKNAVVDEEFAKRYKTKETKSRSGKTDISAYLAGVSAGNRVSINPGVGSAGAPKAIK